MPPVIDFNRARLSGDTALVPCRKQYAQRPASTAKQINWWNHVSCVSGHSSPSFRCQHALAPDLRPSLPIAGRGDTARR